MEKDGVAYLNFTSSFPCTDGFCISDSKMLNTEDVVKSCFVMFSGFFISVTFCSEP